ncbi:9334_t:CDS:2, partial [Dentiscutata heterogama]
TKEKALTDANTVRGCNTNSSNINWADTVEASMATEETTTTTNRNTPQSKENKGTSETPNKKANNETRREKTTDVNKQTETKHVLLRETSLASPNTDESNSQISFSSNNPYNANMIVDSQEPSTSNKVKETSITDQKPKSQEMTLDKTNLINEANPSVVHSEGSTGKDNTNLTLAASPAHKTPEANASKETEEEFTLM